MEEIVVGNMVKQIVNKRLPSLGSKRATKRTEAALKILSALFNGNGMYRKIGLALAVKAQEALDRNDAESPAHLLAHLAVLLHQAVRNETATVAEENNLVGFRSQEWYQKLMSAAIQTGLLKTTGNRNRFRGLSKTKASSPQVEGMPRQPVDWDNGKTSHPVASMLTINGLNPTAAVSEPVMKQVKSSLGFDDGGSNQNVNVAVGRNSGKQKRKKPKFVNRPSFQGR